MQIYGGRTYFWQWDLDQRLVSENFKIGDKVHFHNTMHCKALVCEAYEQYGVVLVDVPNILLQNSLPITVYRMEDDGDGGYHTQQTVSFEVKQRARPDDYVYTETEIFSYAELEKRVNALEKREPGGGEEVIAPNAVLYTEQALTKKQQMQARKNLGLYHQTEEGYDPIPKEYIPGELLPSPTDDMEGQIPCVVGGQWTTVYYGNVSYISDLIETDMLPAVHDADGSILAIGEDIILW